MDIGYYQDLTKRAEAACFDSIFIADHLALHDDIEFGPRTGLEPLTLLAALAVNTSHIGLVATASTTYTEPYNLARQFSSLDHISGGRIGWNIVTTWLAAAAQNYGSENIIAHADRYERAEEYMQVVNGLWDSWAHDALVDDRQSGLYADPKRIREIKHSGRHYKVQGAMNLPRSPQGRPVLVQAGSSESGREFAARYAEMVFTAHMEMATAKDFYEDLKARVVRAGRAEDQALILPGFSPLIGSSEAEAERLWTELSELANPEMGRRRLSTRFGGADLSHLSLDKPLKRSDFPDPSANEAARSRTEVILGVVDNEKPTLRQLLAKLAGARGHFTIAGTPEHIADRMEDWVMDRAADGFNLMPPILPMMLDIFVDEVLPILRKRGLFRTEYEGTTLRSHYGLAPVVSAYWDGARSRS